MANIPEFISVLRRIRDEIYPEVEATYENAVVLKAAIDAGLIELNEDLGLFAIDYTDFKAKYTQIDALVSYAATSAGTSSTNANAAAASALTAITKSNEIKGITARIGRRIAAIRWCHRQCHTGCHSRATARVWHLDRPACIRADRRARVGGVCGLQEETVALPGAIVLRLDRTALALPAMFQPGHLAGTNET